MHLRLFSSFFGFYDFYVFIAQISNKGFKALATPSWVHPLHVSFSTHGSRSDHTTHRHTLSWRGPHGGRSDSRIDFEFVSPLARNNNRTTPDGDAHHGHVQRPAAWA
jgi:hypothetical protein